MRNRSNACLGLLVVTSLFASAAVQASGPTIFGAKKQEPAVTIPLQSVNATQREAVRQILEKPTLSARSQAETFPAKVDAYRYFLDHPERAVTAWRRLQAKCVSIQAHGNQQFSWADENGSEVTWQTVLSQPDLRVWYAEGKVKPGPLLPLVPVKVVVVLRYTEILLPDGKVGLQHQTDMAIHTDSKTALVVTKMLGPSAQRMAEQGLGQFQFFFGGLSFYLSRYPEQAAALMRDEQ
jgi:hypothetical protein